MINNIITQKELLEKLNNAVEVTKLTNHQDSISSLRHLENIDISLNSISDLQEIHSALLRETKKEIVKYVEAVITLLAIIIGLILAFIIIFCKDVYASELTPEASLVYQYVDEVSDSYGISTGFIMAIIEKESCYVPSVSNGHCIGLMQINPAFQKERMQRLGCNNLYDWKQNILVGTDYIYELFQTYEDPALVLMIYNMKYDSAMRLYDQGKLSNYALTILERASEFDEAIEKGVTSNAASQI